MRTATRILLLYPSSSSAVIPDNVSSVDGGWNELGNNFGSHDATENAGEIAATENKPGRQQHRKEKEYHTPKIKNISHGRRASTSWLKAGFIGKMGDEPTCILQEWEGAQKRVTQLEGIEFNCNKPWEQRVNELVTYKEKNGTCNMP